ncbi:MAG: alpha-rhamnosidase, partial [Bacteroidales bacterium]|nr:alpha-rhamnosidase [Bacteroidales bacterium]
KGVDVKDPESVTLIANCVMSDTFGTMAKISAKLGKNDEAKAFEARKKELNDIITKTFYHSEEGFYGSGSQLDMVYPLLVGAVPDGLREKVLSTFFERCREQYNAHIAVGLVGVAILSEWAVEAGEADFMYGMLKKEDYPGYLYMLRSGATATWENWDTPRSHIHNCFNGIASWFYQGPGGIRQEENVPAYRSVIFDPQIPEGLSWAKTSIDTPYGLTSLDWKKDGQSLVMDVRVPVGARGFVVAPEGCSEATVDGEKVSLVRNGSSLGIRLGAGRKEVVFR